MKLTRYRYQGPPSGAQLRVDGNAELLEVLLHPGQTVQLPAEHDYTQVLLTIGHLTPVPVAQAATKKEARP